MFLVIHVVAAILAVGPVAVAASMFPPAVRWGDPVVLRLLYRICRVYALVSIAVPVFGFAVAGSMGVTSQAWVLVSIALTALAAVVLVVFVLPGQRGFLDAEAVTAQPVSGAAPSEGGESVGVVADRRPVSRLGMTTGMFNLLWVAVTVIMIVRPGSTTGV